MPSALAAIGLLAATGCGTPIGSNDSVGATINAPSSTSTTLDDQFDSIDALVAFHEPSGLGAVLVGTFGPGYDATAAAGVDGDARPVTADTPFETASLVKMIVATSVLRLVDQGLVELDAPISSYVDIAVDESIAVRDVLRHRSGIADMTSQLASCPSRSTIDSMKEHAQMAAAPLAETGYSNTNYILLGYLVGQVSGLDIGSYAQTEFFEPLGMSSTYWWESQDGPPVFWKRPVSDPGLVSPFTCESLDVTVGTEGRTFVSTLEDLDTFLRALFGGDLVSPDTLQEMLPNPLTDSGLGIWAETDDDRGVTLYGHFGSRSGFSTVAYYDRERARSVIVFSHDPTEAEDLMWQAWDIALQQSG